MSKEGRKLIAKAISHCKQKHGLQAAREFRDALVIVGAIYPLLKNLD
jgi:hypothetical protein